MTLEVSLLGEKTFISRMKFCAHYLIASMISGAISGFLYTLLLFVFFSWIPYVIKISVLTIMVGLYVLNEFKIIKLKTPQRKWQIPVSWVSGTTTRNMWVWGLILGAGIFTYMPYISFYMMYAYIGLFLNPMIGMLYGLIYGLFRSMPTILVAIKKKKLEMTDIQKLFQSKTAIFRVLNGITLLLLFVFLLTKFF